MRRASIISLACTFACALLLAAPAAAHALDGGYTIDELSTQVTVETNAAVHIVERQTLTFADRNAGVTWYLHVPEDGESVRIANVRVAPVDDGGTLLGDWTRLQMVDSHPREQGPEPGDTASASLRRAGVQPWYSYNIGDGMVRCYFPIGKAAKVASPANGDAASDNSAASDEATDSGATSEDGDATSSETADFHTYVIETDYLIAHRVRVYRDVAELYWRYANDSLPGGARNVNLQIALPVPADADPTAASENVMAWGHGPDEGTFAIGGDGTVTYHIDQIDENNYAEAHVIFPASWMSNLSPKGANRFSELRGPSAISEESQWVDIALREAAWDNEVRVLFLGLAVLVISGGVVGVVRNGRSPRSRRALVRVAATLAIVGLAEHLFFREPLTTAMLAALALACAVTSLALPAEEAPDNGKEAE